MKTIEEKIEGEARRTFEDEDTFITLINRTHLEEAFKKGAKAAQRLLAREILENFSSWARPVVMERKAVKTLEEILAPYLGEDKE